MPTRRFRAVAAAAALSFVVAGAGSAHATDRTTLSVTDKKGDASSNLDIRKVEVIPRSERVDVRVTLSKLGRKPGTSAQSNVWVHFDTGGSAKPDHAMAIDGFHYLTGSTSGWFRLRSNEFGDPYGDWTDCGSSDGPAWVQLSSTKRRITFRAPRECLGDPSRVRVEVSTHKPLGSKKTTDWLGGRKKFTPWVSVG